MTTDPDSETQADLPEDPNTETPTEPETVSEGADGAPAAERPKILIGSQRDAGAVRPPRKRDWFVPGQDEPTPTDPSSEPTEPAAESGPPPAAEVEPATEAPLPEAPQPATAAPLGEAAHFSPPNIRDALPPEMEEELEEALGEVPLDELMTGDDGVTSAAVFEPESKCEGRVVAIHGEDVFVELGGREQGTVPLKQFTEPPDVGAALSAVVVRFNQEEGLYELKLPGAAAEVGDWSDLEEGTLVEVRVTGHNTGGLECEVNRIRGFIPISQVSLYRVEDLARFEGEKMNCLVTEANPERRNLVLSRRAVLEREREEARQQLLESLAPGQVHEGVVRKLMDFGAFVDLGGVDGLLHVSELGWGRVGHPSEVLEEGQHIKVRVLKVNHETRRISLGYREMLENPWEDVERKFPVNTVVQGKVVKLMEFGAFVELEPGIEGLVHISELDHKHVQRVGNVVSEGQQVDVLVKSIDKQQQRISLSIKDTLPPAEPEEKDDSAEPQPPEAKPKRSKPRSSKPLRGGLGRSPGSDRFGLNW